MNTSNKPLFLLYGAVDTISGYGRRAYDIAISIIKSEIYEVKIISCDWGDTPHGFLNPDNPDHKLVLDRIISVNNNQLDKQPDIFFMVTIPTEMQRLGKYNVLCTAGIETTICDPSWIIGCNKADLVLVSSNHAKQTFEQSKFEERDKQTNKIKGKLEIEKPVEVLFEGCDLNIFRKLSILPKCEVNSILNTIEEDFCFLFVGHWLQGDLGQDRKDVGMLIKTFINTFKNVKKAPALILKTSGATYSILDRDNILNKINKIQNEFIGEELPNIYLLHGELDDNEINILYNHHKIKAMVSFTKGEGFGRPLLEFGTTSKPIIASGWSGHLDFLSIDSSILLPGKLQKIHPSALSNMIIPESQWFTVDYIIASETLKKFWKTHSSFIDLGKKQGSRTKNEFSLDKMSEKLLSILDKYAPKLIPLILPNIKL